MKFRKPFSTLIALIVAIMAFSPLATQALDQPVRDLRIHTVHGDSGEPAVDVCYMIENYSDVPTCDEDADGLITFHNVPTGTHGIVQTADIGSLYPIAEPGVNLSTLEIIDEDVNDFHLTLVETGSTTDLNLLTLDPETGESIDGACYELVGYSNVGCDDDGNGMITFEAIPWGTYTVHQTETPEGYAPMGDYDIYLQPFPEAGNGAVNIPLLQAETQGSETSTNVSVIAVHEETADRVMAVETCVEFPGMTETGCDNSVVDGQIDFVGVDPTMGQPTFEVVSLGCGYEAANEGEVTMHRYGEHHIALVLQVGGAHADCAG